jgi:hypothetical protein
LIVEASDGYNTGEGQSNAFTIAGKAPLVSIINPTSTTKPVANQPLILAGGAYDFMAGPLTGSALIWSSDKAGTPCPCACSHLALTAQRRRPKRSTRVFRIHVASMDKDIEDPARIRCGASIHLDIQGAFKEGIS